MRARRFFRKRSYHLKAAKKAKRSWTRRRTQTCQQLPSKLWLWCKS